MWRVTVTYDYPLHRILTFTESRQTQGTTSPGGQRIKMLSRQHASLAAKYSSGSGLYRHAASLGLSPYSLLYGNTTALDPACYARRLVQESSVGYDTALKTKGSFSTFSNRRIEKVNIDQALDSKPEEANHSSSTIEASEKGRASKDSSAEVQQNQKWQKISWVSVLLGNFGRILFLFSLGCVVVGGWVLWEKFGRRLNKMIKMLEKTRKVKEAVKESLARRAKRVREFLKREQPIS